MTRGERGPFSLIPHQAAAPLNLPVDYLQHLKNGVTQARVFGITTYQDIFKKWHATEFCYKFTPDLQIAQFCSEHNKAD